MVRFGSPSDFWHFLYCHIIGSFESLDGARVNFLDLLFSRRFDDTGYLSVDGKTCIVTGANAGIGLVTAKMLAARGAHVVMACRSKARANDAAKLVRTVEVKEGCSKPKVDVLELDLASLGSVNGFCDEVMKKKLSPKLIVCNAGIMRPPKRTETEDGMEIQFQVNHLGHWLLSHRLMTHAIRNKTEEACRVVMVSSMAHLGGKINFDDIHGKKRYDGFLRYGDSKLANVVTAMEFQRRFDRVDDDVRHTAVSVHPGLIDTKLARGFLKGLAPGFVRAVTDPIFDHVLFPACLRSVERGGQAVLTACLSPSEKVAGKYLSYGEVAECSKSAKDANLGRQLWELSEAMTGVGDTNILV